MSLQQYISEYYKEELKLFESYIELIMLRQNMNDQEKVKFINWAICPSSLEILSESTQYTSKKFAQAAFLLKLV